MFKNLNLFLVIYINILITSSIQAQKKFNTLGLKPQIVDEDISNIPATSYNGEYVILKFQNSSCCYSYGEFLCLYKENKEIERIQISPEEAIEWTDTIIDSMKIKIKYLIESRDYYKMTSIHKYKIKTIEKNSVVELSTNDMSYESQSFKINSITLDSYCCSGELNNENHPCKIFPDIVNVWIDFRKKMILIEYGITHGANGCDSGPFFKTIALKNK